MNRDLLMPARLTPDRLSGFIALVAVLLLAPLRANAGGSVPSRPAYKGCAWEQISDTRLGIQAWVQRCDFGFRKIDLKFSGNALVIHYSDGGDPKPLVEVLDLQPGETAEAGIRRTFAVHSDQQSVQHCALAPYRGGKLPAGIKRYTFLPDKAYAKALKAKADPNDIPDPYCGDWGDMPDGIQYFEVQPASGARKLMFVRIGQEEPLFDEQTLRLLPSAP